MAKKILKLTCLKCLKMILNVSAIVTENVVINLSEMAENWNACVHACMRASRTHARTHKSAIMVPSI